MEAAMGTWAIRTILLATAFALAGCGGGGSSGVASISPPPESPPAPPPQPPAIIPAAAASQQFAAFGASHLRSSDDQPTAPLLGADEQLQVRYVASSNSYEVQVPQSQSWIGISFIPTGPGTPINYGGGDAHLWLSTGYDYSRLFEWSDGEKIYGHEAIGMATPTGAVPVTGSASYFGNLLATTSERQGSNDMWINGSIAMSFDFGAGTLAGTISPVLHEDFRPFFLVTRSFVDTVYSTGSTTFSGRFDTSLDGMNSFSGRFTGPAAQELIGNFALPYQSPIDGNLYQADGAFVAK
jgi:hypothetical protein